MEVNLSAGVRQELERNLDALAQGDIFSRTALGIFDAARAETLMMIREDSFKRFTQTRLYRQFVAEFQAGLRKVKV